MGTPGLSKPRLERLHRVLSGHVERGEMPGLVALVSRQDDVHVEVLGTLAVGRPAPMKRDTIFRIASLTKPVTAAAAMILVEECRLRLDDPIDPWLPELADRRVLRSLGSPLDDTMPAARPITVRDLLTSRMGFGSVISIAKRAAPGRRSRHSSPAQAGWSRQWTTTSPSPACCGTRAGTAASRFCPQRAWRS
jgi:CubicO group peptidase (beta-lactamase class C family)